MNIKIIVLALFVSLFASSNAHSIRPGQRVQNSTKLRPKSDFRIAPHISSSMIVKIQDMRNTVKKNATPPMAMIPVKSNIRLVQARFGNYDKNITPVYEISNLGNQSTLDFVLLLPTSGHTGQENAEKWARESKYNVRVIYPDGTNQDLGQVQSLDLITEHGLSIELQAGINIIQMWPQGSAGVGGFKSGREIEIHWDGK